MNFISPMDWPVVHPALWRISGTDTKGHTVWGMTTPLRSVLKIVLYQSSSEAQRYVNYQLLIFKVMPHFFKTTSYILKGMSSFCDPENGSMASLFLTFLHFCRFQELRGFHFPHMY